MEIKNICGVYYVMYRAHVGHKTERCFRTGPTLSIALQRALMSVYA